jgi:hypothetical protein
MAALPSDDRGIAAPPFNAVTQAAPVVLNTPSGQPPVAAQLSVNAKPLAAVRRVVVAAVPVVARATPKPFVCPDTWFCYPKLGLAGPVVPYSDCTATIDIGDAIRRYTCAPGIYLMGHAYTDFGFIRAYQIGDAVIYAGKTFLITSASEAMACQPMAAEQSPLSLQTSLTFERCGKTLVLHAIPILH